MEETKIYCSDSATPEVYSYTREAAWFDFIREQQVLEDKLNAYISECLVLSESGVMPGQRYYRLVQLNEAITDKVSAGWAKIMDFIRRMWGKFVENVTRLITENDYYLEKYKDIILNKQPKFKSLTMQDLDQGVKNIVNTPIKTVNAGMIERIPDAEDNKAGIDAMRTDYFVRAWNNGKPQRNPDGKEFVQWCKDYFTHNNSEEKEIPAGQVNLRDMYQYCKDFKRIQDMLKKDIDNIEKTSNDFVSEINKIKANAKNQATTESVFSRVYNQYLNEDIKVNAAEPTANNNAGNTGNNGTTAAARAQDNINAARQANNGTEEDKAKVAQDNQKAAEADKDNKIDVKARLYIKAAQEVISAKMTAAESINRQYMQVIKYHVQSYVGRTNDGQNRPAQAGTNYQNTQADNQGATNQPAGGGQGGQGQTGGQGQNP